MPSVDDVYNQLVSANTNLQTLHSDLTSLNTSVKQVNATMVAGFDALVVLGTYTNKALALNDQQNETMICILEKISKNTCEILTQVTIQTRLEESIGDHASALDDMFQSVNPGAARELKRSLDERAALEKCCPPPAEPPACTYEPCPHPREKLGPPPKPRDGQTEPPK
ncbi:MAG: hypothetical protein NVS1B9_01080 [Solirubrobacteraceae bacterium]